MGRKRTQKERITYILNKIKKEGKVRTEQLATGARVSRETIYRDIKLLLESGEIVKRYNYYTTDKNYNNPKKNYNKIRYEEQEEIIQKCSEIIKDGDSIILDGGLMIMRLLPYLSCRRDLTVFTTNFEVMKEVVKYKHMSLISLGGFFDKTNSEYYIEEEPNFLKNIKFNKYILLCDGADNGVITIKNEKKVQTIKLLLTKTDNTILLAPLNRFGKTSFANVCTYNDINHVISNSILPKEYIRDLNKYNVIMDLV